MSDRREKQLEIVLKLNKLTKQGKLVWSRVVPSIGGKVGSHLFPPRGGMTEYVSIFQNRSYFLSDAPVVTLLDKRTSGSKFILFIHSGVEVGEISVPPMPATDDLASTVRFQLEDTQDLDKVLKELEEAENLLEG